MCGFDNELYWFVFVIVCCGMGKMIFDNLGGINDMVVSEGMCGLDLFEYIVYYL